MTDDERINAILPNAAALVCAVTDHDPTAVHDAIGHLDIHQLHAMPRPLHRPPRRHQGRRRPQAAGHRTPHRPSSQPHPRAPRGRTQRGRLMTPYYADEHITLYHGRHEDVLPELAIDADLIMADPPYGETTLTWDRWPADIVWEKHNGSGLHADRFKRVHEHAVHWYRGPWATIHHETPTTNDAVARAVRWKAKPAHHQGDRGPTYYQSEDGGPRLMRSVMAHRSMHGRAINETEKPVPLLAPLIEYGCPPGGLVLDPFAGSCSTGIAARQTGRRAVLIEEREEQCERAADRMSWQTLDLAGGV